jgi:hypothetical protein
VCVSVCVCVCVSVCVYVCLLLVCACMSVRVWDVIGRVERTIEMCESVCFDECVWDRITERDGVRPETLGVLYSL